MKILILLVGMVLILEGLPYVAAPEKMRKWLTILSQAEPEQLRLLGGIAMTIGFIVCFIVQRSDIFS